MAKFVPVDYDPFAGAAPEGSTGQKLTPVDHDPFSEKAQKAASGKLVPVDYDPFNQQTEPLPGEVQLQDVPGFISTAKTGPVFYKPTEGVAPKPTEEVAPVELPPLEGPTANVPLPPTRNIPLPPTRPLELGPSAVEVPPQEPEKPTVGPVASAFGDWGKLTKEEGKAAKAERVAATEAAVPVAKAEEADTAAFEQQQLRSFTDKDGVPLVDKIANLEAIKLQARDQGNVDAYKQAQIDINNVKASAPFEFRTLLTKQKIGTTDTEIAADASKKAEEAAIAAKEAPEDTQTFARNAVETVGKTGGDLAIDTVVGAQRLASVPFVAAAAITGQDTTVMSKALNKESELLKSKVDKAFIPDPAKINDLGTKVVAGVASTGFFIAGGAAGSAMKLSPAVATAVLGALPQAEQQWQEAERRGIEDPTVNQEWRKWASFASGLGIGSTESLPVGKLFERLEHASGGGLTRWAGMTMASMGENGLQEGGQQILQNANSIALLKDPNVTLDKDVADSILVGAFSGMATTGPLVGAKMAWSSIGKPKQETPTPSDATEALTPAAPSAEVPPATNLPSAPSAAVENQAKVLKNAGYAMEDIADMTDGQRESLALDALEQGVEPTELTDADIAALIPQAPAQPSSPVALVEARGPDVAPAPEAPSAKAQALVEAGTPPLEAMQEAAAAPKAPKPTSESVPAITSEPTAESNKESDRIAKIVGAYSRNELQLKTKSNAGNTDIYYDGEKLGTVKGLPNQESVAKVLVQKLLDAYKEEGRVIPRDPRNMTLDEFSIAQAFHKIIPQFEVYGDELSNVVDSGPSGFHLNIKGLYDKIQKEANTTVSEKAPEENISAEVPIAAEEPIDMKLPKVRGPVKNPRTLIGYIKSLGGIKDESGELRDRGLASNTSRGKGLINENGLSHEEALSRAISAGFYPNYVAPIDQVGGESYQPPAEMVDQFRDDLAANITRPKTEEEQQKIDDEEARQEEKRVLGPYIKEIKDNAKKRGFKMSDDVIRDAAIMVHRGQYKDSAEAVDMAQLINDMELIGDNMTNADREELSNILGQEYWDDAQSIYDMKMEGDLRPEEVEPLTADFEPLPEEQTSETNAPSAPEAGTVPRKGGKQVKEPAATPEPEAISKPVEAEVSGKPEVKPELEAPTVEKGAEGKPQLVIPGAEKISDKEYAERLAEKPLSSNRAQAEPGGMFGADVGQPDLVDMAKQPEPVKKAAEKQPLMPKDVIEGKPLSENDKAQRDEINIMTDIPPEEPPPPPKDISLEEARQILSGKKLTVQKKGDAFLVGGSTFNYKSIMRDNNGRWNAKEKSWSFTYDPTQNIAATIKEVDAATSAARAGGEDTGPVGKRGETERILQLRQREDGRPDERISNASAKVSDGTKSLIANGLKYGIPEEVVNDQIEDVGMALNAFDKGKPMFLLANEAGTGKTFVLGGIIRELRNKGVKKFAYVTQSQDLIAQIKRDLTPYGVDDVQFVTYAQMNADVKDGILIFDEAHNVKNVADQTGRAVEGQKLMGSAKMTIFASATPFQNPVEAAYLAGTGVFDSSGGFVDWAKAYGSLSKSIRFFNPKTRQDQTIDKLYWVSTPEKKKDGAAARNWFLKQGVMTQRAMKIDPKMVDVTFQRNAVDQQWVDLYNKVNDAYDVALGDFEDEDGNSSDNKVSGEIKRHRETMVKRILEAAKAKAAIARANALLADGKNVVIFVETKADRHIGRFRRSTFFKDDRLYSYPEMEKMMNEWAIEAAGAKMMKETPPPRPFAAFIYAIAQGMNKVGIDQMLPSTADDIMEALGGKEKVAVYTGAASQAQATKDKEAFMSGKKKVLIATMAKGGTGLSLHDTIGNRPTVQVNLNLPWAAWQVDQVSARVARYGLKSKANVEWLFASNIPWEATKLAPRIGARMADMGAIVKGIEVKAAEKLLGDFDFEGELDVKNKKGEGNIEYSSSGFTPRAEIIIPNIISRVEEAVKRMVGNKIAVQFVDQITMVDPEAARMSGGEEGGSAAGSYDNANGIIKLAMDMADPAAPLYTAYHEAYHPVSSLLTDQERAILRNNVAELRNISTNFYRMTNEQFDALSPDEQEAYAFGAYGYMMDQGDSVPAGPARGIMGRLRHYWKNIVSAIKGALGKRTYEDVFSDIHLGRMRERFDTARINMPSPRYAAAKNQPNLPGVPSPVAQQPKVQNILPGLPIANRTGLAYEINRSGFGSGFHYQLTDKFIDLHDWIKAVEAARGAKIQDTENAALANQLFQDRAIALQNKANEEELKPLTKAMEKEKISTGDMGMFLYAQHAPERNEVMRQRDPARFGQDGSGSGMTDDEAADIIQQFKDAGKYDVLEKLANDHVYPMIQKDVKLRYLSGLLTQEQYQQYTASRLNGGYDHYVPLTGYAEDENELTNKPPRVGKGFAVYGQEYKTAYGRNSLALNPLFSLINRRMEGITRAEKTRVISRLYNFVRNNPNPDFAEIVKPGADFRKVIGADGTVQMVPTNSVRMDPFVLTHKIGGKEVYIKFNNSNPNMARLVAELKNMTEAPDATMKATMAMGRYLSKINTQWVVDFMMVNFPRDVQDAMVTIYGEKKGLAPKMMQSIASASKIIAMHNSGATLSAQDKALLNEWMESGGKVDYTGLWNLENTVKRIEAQLNEKWTDMNAAQRSLSVAKKMGNGVLEAVEAVNDTFDSAVRLSVYMAARKAGYTKDRAAQLGRNSTVDFRTGGKLKPLLNALYPFSGTAIAGSKALTRLLKSKRARYALGSVVMAGMISGILGSYLSDDDDEDPTKKKFWTQIKSYERHNSIVLPFKINGRYVKFAAGFYISPFWSLGDQMAGVLTGNVTPTDAAINVATSIANSFNPIGSGSIIHNIIPIQLRGAVETWMNKDWQDRQMHPERPGYAKSTQYYDKTSDTAITLADWINRKFGGNPYKSSVMDMYPSNIDYWFRYATGAAGSQITGSGKAVWDYLHGVETPVETLPFARRVLTSEEHIDDSAYGKMRNEIKQKTATLSSAHADSTDKTLPKERRDEAKSIAKDLRKELGETFNGKKVESAPNSAPGIIKKTDKKVHDLESKIDKINIRPDLSVAEKKALTSPIQQRVTAIKNEARKKIIHKEQIKAPPAPSPLNQLRTMFQ